MTKAPHTPGPWHTTPGQVPPESVWDDSGKLRIASFIGGRGWQEADANARLIAAAPELLDELIMALPFVDCWEEDKGYKPGSVTQQAKRIRELIAKALGEA